MLVGQKKCKIGTAVKCRVPRKSFDMPFLARVPYVLQPWCSGKYSDCMLRGIELSATERHGRVGCGKDDHYTRFRNPHSEPTLLPYDQSD